MVFNLFRRDPRRVAIATLYRNVATASRAPALYTGLGVPDTLEGRFESLSLHMILTVRALRHMPEPAGEIAGDLTDAFFADLDSSLREMGVGDTVVPKRMKKLASSFFGRTDAYHGPLDAADEDRLMVALARNVVGEEGASSHALARYALAAERNLRHSSVDAFMNQGVPFPQPETFTEATS